MKSAKFHQEEEEEETPPSNDGKINDKPNSTRSKHSVTEQRRRSKINERFQILRDLIPRSDQKRDTASFLLEVIDYVHYMQEKVQKYEGSYQGWVPEPSKLMPWRNSHWRVQGFVGHPCPITDGSSPGSAFTGRLDENDSSISPTIHPNQQHSIESDSSGDPSGKMVDLQPELTNKSMAMPMPLQATIPSSIQHDGVLSHSLQRPISNAQSTDYPSQNDRSNHEEDSMVEGGRINIRSAYSQGLLNNLTQALKSAGVDLSQATISVQIDLGKQAHTGPTPGISIPKDPQNSPSRASMGRFGDEGNDEDQGQAQKRLKK